MIHSLGVSVGDEHNAEHVQTSIPPHDEVPRIRNVRSAHVHQRSSLDSQFGRLFIEDGKSRYVNNLFWANLNDEVCSYADLVNQLMVICRSRTLKTLYTTPPRMKIRLLHGTHVNRLQRTKRSCSTSALLLSTCTRCIHLRALCRCTGRFMRNIVSRS